MVKLIKADFDGAPIQFNDDGWFNATIAAERFGKRVDNWLRTKEAQEYIDALNTSHSRDLNTRNSGDLTKTKRGKNGGTWLHPKLAIVFARWCSVEFAIWCDEQIDKIIHGDKNSIDWELLRHASKSSNKVANDIIKLTRKELGKETQHFHYANEAKLVNHALTGEFKSIDRDSLSAQNLDLLAKLESRNAVLIARGVDRETRKEILSDMATIKLK